MQNKFWQVFWPRLDNIITGQEGPTWWVIHHDILEAVIQTWTGTAWTGTRACNFSTSFRFGFCSEVSELHGWSADGHAKICEGVMTADPHREHIGPSSRVHSCLNLFFPVRNGMENFALKFHCVAWFFTWQHFFHYQNFTLNWQLF